MNREYRSYKCSVCGHKDQIQTNHIGNVLHYCKNCSWKRNFAGSEHSHYISKLGNQTYRVFVFDPDPKLNEIMNKKKLNSLVKHIVKEAVKSENATMMPMGDFEKYLKQAGVDPNVYNRDQQKLPSLKNKSMDRIVKKPKTRIPNIDPQSRQPSPLHVTPLEENEERHNEQELARLFKTINPQSGIYGETPFSDNLRNFAYIIMTKFGKNSGDAIYVITHYWRQSEEVATKIVNDVIKHIAKQKHTGKIIPRGEEYWQKNNKNENAMEAGPGVKEDQRLYLLGRKLDEIDREATKYHRLSQERVALEDERSKVWVEFRQLYEKIKGTKVSGIHKEDHGLGFSHNFSTPVDQNTMDKSTIKEQNSPEERRRQLNTSQPNKAVKMLFDWIKSNKIEYVEFEDLLADIVAKVCKQI
jgi:DNA-directed RNA polymerase subunit RPC12/RpoP